MAGDIAEKRIMDMKKIVNELNTSIISDILDTTDIDAWNVRIHDFIDSIVESRQCAFTLECRGEDAQFIYTIIINGGLEFVSDHRFKPEVNNWSIEYKNTETDDLLKYKGHSSDYIDLYVRNLVEFSRFFSRFGYQYRQYKQSGLDENMIDISFLFDPESVWETYDERNTPWEYYTEIPEFQEVYVYDDKRSIFVSISEDTGKGFLEYHSDAGINTPLNPDLLVTYDGRTRTILGHVKQGLNRRAKEDNSIEVPPLFVSDIEYDKTHILETHDFIIRTTKLNCAQYNHILERITASIQILVGSKLKTVEAKAMYCYQCNEYYITESEYKRLKRIGIICPRVVTADEYIHAKSDYSNWAQKSILACHGYDASKQSGLADTTRHCIIDLVISSGEMTPQHVLSHLEWLVRNRGERCHYACNKWENDIEYVCGYIQNGRKVAVGSIYDKKYHLL